MSQSYLAMICISLAFGLENQKVRTAWDEEKQEWFFSIVDVCGVLTEQPDYDGARKYWKVLKGRLITEDFELVSNCYQLHMKSPKDGENYKTDVAIYPGYYVPFPKADEQ